MLPSLTSLKKLKLSGQSEVRGGMYEDIMRLNHLSSTVDMLIFPIKNKLDVSAYVDGTELISSSSSITSLKDLQLKSMPYPLAFSLGPSPFVFSLDFIAVEDVVYDTLLLKIESLDTLSCEFFPYCPYGVSSYASNQATITWKSSKVLQIKGTHVYSALFFKFAN